MRGYPLLDSRPAAVLGEILLKIRNLQGEPRLFHRKQKIRVAIAIFILQPVPEFTCCLAGEEHCPGLSALRLIRREVEALLMQIKLFIFG